MTDSNPGTPPGSPGPDEDTAPPSPGLGPGPRRTVLRWLKSTSNRSFALYPVCIIALEAGFRGGDLAFVPWGVPLLVWGYLQYRFVGSYRGRLGGGGPGLAVPPDRIIDYGPYKYLRNPMYMGHLIFMCGLTISFQSLPALGLLAFHMVWFNCRVMEDEKHLEEIFGAQYIDYKARVKRWIPGIY